MRSPIKALSIFAVTASLALTSLALTSCGDDAEKDDGGSTTPAATVSYSLSYPTLASYYEIGTAMADAPVSSNYSVAQLSNFTVSPNLPGGVFLNSTTGKITGTPVGEWLPQQFTITAARTGGTVSGKVTFGVHKVGDTAVDPATTTPRNFTYDRVEITAYKDENISPLLPSFQGDLTDYFSMQGSPSGMQINPSTGVISGASAYTGDYDFQVATSVGQYGFQYFTEVKIHVLDAPLVNMQYSRSPAIFPRNEYLVIYPAFDRGTPTSYSISPTTLPNGLSFNAANGFISGVPNSNVAAANFTITATNAVNSVSTVLRISVGDSAPQGLTYSKTNPRYIQNVGIADNVPSVNTTGGVATSFSVSPALPAGLTLNTSSGTISGTPTALQASASYVITATNAAGSTTFSLPIAVVAASTSTLYTADGSALKAYSVDSVNGDPTYLGNTIASTVTSRLIFHPTYDCMVGYSGTAVESFSVNKSQHGALTSVSSLGGVSSPAAIVQSANGNNIFVANSSFVAGYTIDSSCTLTHVADVSSASAVDMTIIGDNIYVFNSGAGIQHFKNNGSGTLTYTSSAAMVAHANPGVSGTTLGNGLTLAADPSGSYLYAIDSERAVATFTVNASTGVPTYASVALHQDWYYFRKGFVIDGFIIHPMRASNHGIASLKMNNGGVAISQSKMGASEVGAGFSYETGVTAHTSASGTYIYAGYSIYSNLTPTASRRLKLNTDGTMTIVDQSIAGVVGGY